MLPECLQSPDCTIATLDRLSKHEQWRIRQAVARHNNTPIQTLQILSTDTHPQVRQAAAKNSHCTLQMLQEFIMTTDPWALPNGVANNPNTPPELLTQLAHSPEKLIRASVAAAPQCPLTAFLILCTDDQPTVRQAILKNMNTPSIILDKFTNTNDAFILHSLAKHPNTSEPTLMLILKRHPPERTFDALMQHPNLPQSLRTIYALSL